MPDVVVVCDPEAEKPPPPPGRLSARASVIDTAPELGERGDIVKGLEGRTHFSAIFLLYGNEFVFE